MIRNVEVRNHQDILDAIKDTLKKYKYPDVMYVIHPNQVKNINYIVLIKRCCIRDVKWGLLGVDVFSDIEQSEFRRCLTVNDANFSCSDISSDPTFYDYLIASDTIRGGTYEDAVEFLESQLKETRYKINNYRNKSIDLTVGLHYTDGGY